MTNYTDLNLNVNDIPLYSVDLEVAIFNLDTLATAMDEPGSHDDPRYTRVRALVAVARDAMAKLSAEFEAATGNREDGEMYSGEAMLEEALVACVHPIEQVFERRRE